MMIAKFASLIVTMIFSFSIWSTECPRSFEGSYIWLDEINNIAGEAETFFHNALEVKLSLDESCQSLNVRWNHLTNFTLEWTNHVGEFDFVDGEEEMRQKLILSSSEMVEILQRMESYITTTTYYRLLDSNTLEVTVETRHWGEADVVIEVSKLRRI